MLDIEESELRELDKSVLTRLNRIEAALSAGNTTTHDFEDVGLEQKVELLRGDIDRLEAAINDIELNASE